jgi:hypothetical protein
MVPLFYEVEACKASNYKYFGDWQDLTVEEKAFLIAHHFLSGLITAHKEEAQAGALERIRRQKAANKGRR